MSKTGIKSEVKGIKPKTTSVSGGGVGVVVDTTGRQRTVKLRDPGWRPVKITSTDGMLAVGESYARHHPLRPPGQRPSAVPSAWSG